MESLNLTKPARFFIRASIAASVVLPFVALTERRDLFYAAAIINFVLFHLIWLSQFLDRKDAKSVDFTVARAPLIAFALLGNGAWILLILLES